MSSGFKREIVPKRLSPGRFDFRHGCIAGMQVTGLAIRYGASWGAGSSTETCRGAHVRSWRSPYKSPHGARGRPGLTWLYRDGRTEARSQPGHERIAAWRTRGHLTPGPE